MIHKYAPALIALLLPFTACGGGQSSTSTPAPAPSASADAPPLGALKALGGIAVTPPTAWSESPPSSNMRRAQWAVGTGEAAAEMIVYYFGNAGAGSLQANLDRWFSQFEQTDGRPSKEAAMVEQKTVADMAVTYVDVGGTYVAQLRPGAEERHNKPDWHMLAAIVLAPDGAYYFKMVGPRATVAGERPGFSAMLASLSKVANPHAEQPAASPHPQPQPQPQPQ